MLKIFTGLAVWLGGIAIGQAGEALSVPGSGVTFLYESIKVAENGHVLALIRHDGRRGTWFTYRAIDCHGHQFKYLGEGRTVERAMNGTHGTLMPLKPKTLAFALSKHACDEVGFPILLPGLTALHKAEKYPLSLCFHQNGFPVLRGRVVRPGKVFRVLEAARGNIKGVGEARIP